MSGAGTRIIRVWKPHGVLTKFTDPEGRPTLADLVDVPDVYPAGRLDKDSEGLLLLTSSGRLQERLTDPRHGHPRTYLVQVEGIPGDQALDRLRSGVELKDGWSRPADARLLGTPPDLPPRAVPIRERESIPDSWLELTLTEGRNRQVRRMTAAVGHPTLRLVRSAIGPIDLRGLTPGAWADLSDDDVAALEASLTSAASSRGSASRSARGRRRSAPRSSD